MSSTTRPPQPGRAARTSRAQRRGEIRDRLRGATEQLMAEGESFTALSVERIVRAAGISRATFYVYFEDKSDLLQALAEDFFDHLLEAASLWWTLPADAVKDDLRRAMQAIFDAYLPDRLVMAAVVEVASYDARVAEAFGGLLQRTIDEVAGHIRTGQREGYVTPGPDPERTAAWLTWLAERGLYQLVAAADAAEAERLLGALTDITWNVLYAGTRR